MGKLDGLPLFFDTMHKYIEPLEDEQSGKVLRAAFEYVIAFNKGEERNAPEFDSAEAKTAYEKLIEDIHYYAERDEEDRPF